MSGVSIRPEWELVKAHAVKQLEAAKQALETCDMEKVEYYRGRIHAMRSILDMAEVQPLQDGVVTMPSNF